MDKLCTEIRRKLLLDKMKPEENTGSDRDGKSPLRCWASCSRKPVTDSPDFLNKTYFFSRYQQESPDNVLE